MSTYYILFITYFLLTIVFVVYVAIQHYKLTNLSKKLIYLNENIFMYQTRHTSRLYALFAVSRRMGVETNLQKIFDCITKTCKDTFDCQQASLMLYDKNTQMLIVQSVNGHLHESKIIGKKQKIGEGVAGWAAKHRRPLLLNKDCDVKQYEGLVLKSQTLSAAIVVPIILRDELVGVVNISTRSKHVKYDQEDMRALRVFAENAGACIRHAEQAKWMQERIRRLQQKQSARL